MHCHRFPGPKKEWLCNFLDCSKLPPCYTNFIIISYHRQHQYSPKSRWIRNINMCVVLKLQSTIWSLTISISYWAHHPGYVHLPNVWSRIGVLSQSFLLFLPQCVRKDRDVKNTFFLVPVWTRCPISDKWKRFKSCTKS